MFILLLLSVSLAGLVFLHVDDFLHMGNNYFESSIIQGRRSKYNIGKYEERSFVYTGLNIQELREGITIDQIH